MKLNWVVLLIESNVMPDVVSRSRRVMFPLPCVLSMHLPPVERFLAILHFFTNSRLLTIKFLNLFSPGLLSEQSVAVFN